MTSWVPFDLLDHLWQSTLFAGCVWLVTYAVRTNAARVRYWLWFAASLKFLLPMSMLVSVGEPFAWRTTPAATPPVTSVIEQVLTPTAATIATAPAAAIVAPTVAWPVLLLVAWAAGVLFIVVRWWQQWLPVRYALRHARAVDMDENAGLAMLESPSMLEPAVFGIWRPVLLVPAGIRDRLTRAQMRALIAHEECHVRHHDNLTAALHMAVEALFWFHPLVWWLEDRLMEERERACDEYVLQSGSTPRDYAEGILEVCRFAKSRSPVFVAGVTSSNLRSRIEAILQGRTGRPLSVGGVVTLAVCAAAAVLGPVTAGAVRSTTPGQDALDNSPYFEVASIRPTPPNPPVTTLGPLLPGGRWSPRNVTVRMILSGAFPEYALPGMIVGGPGWLTERHFDIDARTDATATPAQHPQMIRRLLSDRFRLKTHVEARPVDVYSLTLARGDGRLGPRLRPASAECRAELEATRELERAWRAGLMPPGAEPKPCHRGVSMRNGMMRIAGGHSISEMAAALQSWTELKIVDRTGLRGDYEVEIEFDFRGTLSAGSASAERPSVFTAIQEQLGLKLERRRELLDVLVIDAVEMPSEN